MAQSKKLYQKNCHDDQAEMQNALDDFTCFFE